MGKKPYRFLSVTDVLKRARPRPLVGSVISEGEFVVLYGPPGMGKTLVALDIALSVACGCPWLHHPVRRSGVVYVVGEARGPFGARVAAWQQTHGALAAEWQGCREAEVDYSNIRFLFDELLLLERDDTERFCTGIEAAGADLRPGLIVLDTWACATAGAEENSNKDMNLACLAASRLTETFGSGILVLHHPRKNDATVLRGAGGIGGHADSTIQVTKTDTTHTLTNTKRRDYIEFPPISVERLVVPVPGADPHEPETGATLALQPCEPPATSERGSRAGICPSHRVALRALDDAGPGGARYNEWLRLSDLAATTFDKAATALVARHLVTKTGTGEYGLTPAGRAALTPRGDA